MGWQGFLYRRLAAVATCELRLATGATVALGSKFAVASFADVFAHPFYWQLLTLLDDLPATVLDCGAHCGHFTVLADACVKARYGTSADRYVLIEPNPHLLPVICRTITDAGLFDRSVIVHGLLGGDAPAATLWVDPRNYLASGLKPAAGRRPHSVACVRAVDCIPAGPVDVLKIDVEGGEYPLLRTEPELFERTRVVFLEVHQAPDKEQAEFFARLAGMGFRDAGPRLTHCGQTLAVLKK